MIIMLTIKYIDFLVHHSLSHVCKSNPRSSTPYFSIFGWYPSLLLFSLFTDVGSWFEAQQYPLPTWCQL
jgi:hypothetical protein